MSTAAKQLKGRAARLARLMPSGSGTAARTPFVLLVVLLLSGGLITLLLLNSSLNQGSFQLSEIKKRTTELTDEEQALQRDVDSRSAPDALERRARELGMVPGGNPAFLGPDGRVRGEPVEATAQARRDPSPLATSAAPSRPAAPSRAPSPSASPTAPPPSPSLSGAAGAPPPSPSTQAQRSAPAVPTAPGRSAPVTRTSPKPVATPSAQPPPNPASKPTPTTSGR
ncbi:septum formation initiator family protein [Streptomyces sp. NPDC002889]|uniref:FtsB family cell division protein n=1 Tax=Streptomyces sp. NPDC002889 TaxID=3364669 RepID=UPI0036852729